MAWCLLALGTFGVGFVIPSLGGTPLGIHAERVDRRPALTLTIMLIASAMLSIGSRRRDTDERPGSPPGDPEGPAHQRRGEHRQHAPEGDTHHRHPRPGAADTRRDQPQQRQGQQRPQRHHQGYRQRRAG